MLQHLFFITLYCGLALLAVLFGPTYIPELQTGGAMLLGLWVFLAGVVLHEIMTRRSREEETTSTLETLHHNQAVLRDRISWTRREMLGMAEALEGAAKSSKLSAEQSIINDALSEVNLLKTLMPRLTDPFLGLFEDETNVIKKDQRVREEGEARRAKHPDFLDDFRPENYIGKTVREPAEPEAVSVLTGLGETEVLSIVRQSLRDDRIEMFLQPVVALPQRKRKFYECLSRLRTSKGQVIEPGQYVAIATRAGLITAIDNMLLFRCVQIIRKILKSGDDIAFFVNLSSHTLKDHDFFDDFVEFVRGNIELAPHLIIEVAQKEFLGLKASELLSLERLMGLGCRLSLDQVQSLDMDLEALANGRVRFLKLEGWLFAENQIETKRFLEQLRGLPIELVIEKVETEDALVQVLGQDVSYGQGFLFGEPRPARP
ncbi:EAL domain-containing protein [Kiloniella laminariae]|uniref:EAL domain-containing protein n=1 Tax=Kiloniella laminariae TaxID=454162 RepID=A0ABT4LQJ7_9PROT|nr:EAL domain-containing protein [Kiloniella laminariae]MCZ4282207.1 EAL domain-containing protein [Kiloniella laminariae]